MVTAVYEEVHDRQVVFVLVDEDHRPVYEATTIPVDPESIISTLYPFKISGEISRREIEGLKGSSPWYFDPELTNPATMSTVGTGSEPLRVYTSYNWSTMKSAGSRYIAKGRYHIRLQASGGYASGTAYCGSKYSSGWSVNLRGGSGGNYVEGDFVVSSLTDAKYLIATGTTKVEIRDDDLQTDAGSILRYAQIDDVFENTAKQAGEAGTSDTSSGSSEPSNINFYGNGGSGGCAILRKDHLSSGRGGSAHVCLVPPTSSSDVTTTAPTDGFLEITRIAYE